MSWDAGRTKIRQRLYGLPVVRGIFYRLAQLRGQYDTLDRKYSELDRKYSELDRKCSELNRKYDALSVQYHALAEKDRGLDWRIDDVYHEIFLNRKEMQQRYYELLPKEKYPQALEQWYFEETGRKLDLAHPKTLNEKIQWIKLYGLNEKCTQLADKYAARKYIEKVLGKEYLIPLLGVWDTFDEIDFDQLPDQFVLKANHGSGMNVVVRDKAAFDRTEARKLFQRWMSVNYAFYTGFELQYSEIPRKIIAEAYLEDVDGRLREYQVYCFHGKPAYISYYESCSGVKSMANFSLDWEHLPFQSKGYPCLEDVPKPDQLEMILQLSQKLSGGFIVLRSDWYLMQNGEIKLGELTFTPGSGVSRKHGEQEYERMTNGLLQIPAD